MIPLLIAALADSLGVVTSKFALTRERLTPPLFNGSLFVGLALLTALTLPWLGQVEPRAFEPKYLGLFIGMVVLVAVWNHFFARALQSERIEEFESIVLFVPLLTAVFAALIFPDERNARVLMSLAIASVALLASHLHRGHLEFHRADEWVSFAVVLIAAEALLLKPLLEVWSPAALYFARTAVVAGIFLLVQRPAVHRVTLRQWRLVVLAALFGVVLQVLKYTGYQSQGIVYTTLILILAPFLTLLLGKLLLKERLHPRYLLAIAVTIVAIIYASV